MTSRRCYTRAIGKSLRYYDYRCNKINPLLSSFSSSLWMKALTVSCSHEQQRIRSTIRGVSTRQQQQRRQQQGQQPAGNDRKLVSISTTTSRDICCKTVRTKWIINNERRILSCLTGRTIISSSSGSQRYLTNTSSSSSNIENNKNNNLILFSSLFVFAAAVAAAATARNNSKLFHHDESVQDNNKRHNTSLQQHRPRRPPTFGKSILNNSSTFSTIVNRKYSSSSNDGNDKMNHDETVKDKDGDDKNHHDDNSDDDNDTDYVIDKDCPICQKYSKGPCGKMFRMWLQCTDENPGIDPTTNESIHLTKCADYAAKLATCLEENQSYYEFESDFDSTNNNNDNDIKLPTQHQQQEVRDTVEAEELHDAWEEFVKELLSSSEEPSSSSSAPVIKKTEFPNHSRPEMTIGSKKKDGKGVVFFPMDISNQTLVMAFVVQGTVHNKKKEKEDYDQSPLLLLSAGGRQDLFVIPDNDDVNEKTMGVLEFKIPPATTVITAWGLYEEEEEEGPQDTQMKREKTSIITTHEDHHESIENKRKNPKDHGNLVLYYQTGKVPPIN